MKTVAITGATGTLGRAVAERFAEGGWRVKGCGSEVDVRSNTQVANWFCEIKSVDAVVTCAGISLVKPSRDLTDEEWVNIHNVNFHGTRRAVIEAIKCGASRVVVIGSIHGGTDTSYPYRSPYTSSKKAVVGLVHSLAVEFALCGIGIFCVNLGHLPALMDGTGASYALLDAVRNKTPTGELTTPEEVADIIWWLCVNAPLSMTGSTLLIDGGFTLNTFPMG